MIKSFRHKGLERYFETGSMAGIQARHADRLLLQLTLLNVAQAANEMDAPGWNLHALQGDMAGLWSLKVSGKWRLTFGFEGVDAVLVDYQDYH